jgi:hypothetical protein
MTFEPIVIDDLADIAKLQPSDWPDIIPNIRFYINSPFCKPIKIVSNGSIVGIGCSIEFANTAWLAHIIVNPDNRKSGIGSFIVKTLIEKIDHNKTKSILLIATALGEPIYLTAGFRKMADYTFLKKNMNIENTDLHINISPYDDSWREQVLMLDKSITGEDRGKLIELHLLKSLLYIDNNHLKGYYIPSLGEGPIVAKEDYAGFELMKFKYASLDKAVIPANNISGIKFLKQLGFIETMRCSRMIMGKELTWQPERIFSRIGGNFG